MRVCFLGSKVHDDLCVSHSLHFQNLSYFLVHYHEDGISSFLTGFIIVLGHASKVFAKGSLPYFRGGEVMHEFFVAAYCFACGRMHHLRRELFIIKIRWQIFRTQFVRVENFGRLRPHTFGEEVNGLLTNERRLQTPPTIGTKRTRGSRVGLVVGIGARLRLDLCGSCA